MPHTCTLSHIADLAHAERTGDLANQGNSSFGGSESQGRGATLLMRHSAMNDNYDNKQ